MSKTDWLLLALNAAAAFVTIMLGVEVKMENPSIYFIAFLAAPLALVLSSMAIARRAEQGGADRDGVTEQTSEMNAETVLDLDARLEALERAQHDAVDAARWRALVESGQVTAPASDPPAAAASGARAASRNGL